MDVHADTTKRRPGSGRADGDRPVRVVGALIYDLVRLQRARAALRAIARRRAALKLLARARPPFSPPRRPSAAAWGFFSGTPVSAAESRAITVLGVTAIFVTSSLRVAALCRMSRRAGGIPIIGNA